MIEDWKEDINDFIDEADACLKEVEESLELFDDMKYSRARRILICFSYSM